MTRQNNACLHPGSLVTPETSSTCQSTPWRVLCTCIRLVLLFLWPSMHVARACEQKPGILKTSKQYFYSLYFYIFLHESLTWERTPKSLEDILVLSGNKITKCLAKASKCTIDCFGCVMFWRHSNPPFKIFFVRISTVFFVLKTDWNELKD